MTIKENSHTVLLDDEELVLDDVEVKLDDKDEFASEVAFVPTAR